MTNAPPPETVTTADVAPAPEFDRSRAPEALPGFPQTPPEPVPFQEPSADRLLGTSLWLFGALLWTYVVLGEWVVKASFPEPLAILIVIGVFAGSWYVSAKAPSHALRTHPILPGIIAFVSWAILLLLVSTLLGTHRTNEVAYLTVFLWVVGALSFWYGRRLLGDAKPSSAMVRKWTRVAWGVVGIGTAVALILAVRDF